MQSFSKAFRVQKARKIVDFRVFKDLMAQGVRAYTIRIRMRHGTEHFLHWAGTSSLVACSAPLGFHLLLSRL